MYVRHKDLKESWSWIDKFFLEELSEVQRKDIKTLEKNSWISRKILRKSSVAVIYTRKIWYLAKTKYSLSERSQWPAKQTQATKWNANWAISWGIRKEISITTTYTNNIIILLDSINAHEHIHYFFILYYMHYFSHNHIFLQFLFSNSLSCKCRKKKKKNIKSNWRNRKKSWK